MSVSGTALVIRNILITFYEMLRCIQPIRPLGKEINYGTDFTKRITCAETLSIRPNGITSVFVAGVRYRDIGILPALVSEVWFQKLELVSQNVETLRRNRSGRH